MSGRAVEDKWPWVYTVAKGGGSGEARKMERSLRPLFLVPSPLREIDALILEEKLAFIAQRAYSNVEVIFLRDASPSFFVY